MLELIIDTARTPFQAKSQPKQITKLNPKSNQCKMIELKKIKWQNKLKDKKTKTKTLGNHCNQ
jgi:hypothetical protein